MSSGSKNLVSIRVEKSRVYPGREVPLCRVEKSRVYPVEKSVFIFIRVEKSHVDKGRKNLVSIKVGSLVSTRVEKFRAYKKVRKV